MVDPVALRRSGYRALFVALVAGIVFVRILPIHVEAETLPAPDLIALLAFAWVLRRPDYVPVLLIAVTGLATDILFMQPLGLGAAFLVIATELLRGRGHISARLPFPVEWLMVSLVLAAMSAVRILAYGIFLLPGPPLAAAVLQLAVSIVCYPLVVVATAYGFGVRPPAAADGDMIR